MEKKTILYIDGACRGNPGPGAIGIVIQDGNNRLQISKCVGDTTNNQAEYQALITAIEEALKMGARHLDIRTDSELLARQIQKTYRVKNAKLKPLYEKANQLLRRVDSYTITHIPREKNTIADGLANKALDQKRADRSQ